MVPHSARRRMRDGLLRGMLWLSGGLVAALLAAVAGYVLFRGLPHLTWELLTTQTSVLRDTRGIWPNLGNTLYVVGVSLALVLPLGVGAAVYLTEYAPSRRLAGAIEFAAGTLAGIPSILYGLVGMLVFCQLWGLQASLLAGSLTLAVMTFPTVLRTTQESLKTVPQSYREGALGLGSGKWRMIRTVVLPAAADGIVTGCILAVGRVVGESAALLFTAGMGMSLNHVFASWENFSRSSGATLTVALYVYAKERADFDTAFAIAVLLLGLTLVLNGAARLAGRSIRQRGGEKRE
ncbi:MAG: phosphate ABC transporter permease PstA [Flavonifractor sp.]|nr:phosphate ABC transporter permease PstA [Flavonifractor sp.]MCI9425241.1 phosphate ABC transporter permease PstA [Flavonifractor sp.]MCI9473196.1 phosphate ABC transporter permease PstA [Flavonifractor sp.]